MLDRLFNIEEEEDYQKFHVPIEIQQCGKPLSMCKNDRRFEWGTEVVVVVRMMRCLTTETVKGTALSLQSVDDVWKEC